jgi:hypothetical protein
MNANRRRTIGYLVSAVPGIVMLLTAALKIAHHPSAVENFVVKFGLSERLLTPLGVLEIICTGFYMAPRVSTVGAILLTGYLGGAIATELRASGDVWFAVLMAGIVWLGLAVRESRVAVALGRREPIT